CLRTLPGSGWLQELPARGVSRETRSRSGTTAAPQGRLRAPAIIIPAPATMSAPLTMGETVSRVFVSTPSTTPPISTPPRSFFGMGTNSEAMPRIRSTSPTTKSGFIGSMLPQGHRQLRRQTRIVHQERAVRGYAAVTGQDAHPLQQERRDRAAARAFAG